LEELYKACEIALEICNEKSPVARVIARPYVGKKVGEFKRTANRHDFSIDPPRESMLERLEKAGLDVVGIGKTSDLFNGKGITDNRKANQDNLDGIKKTIAALKEDTKGLIFTNLVDFDALSAHNISVKVVGVYTHSLRPVARQCGVENCFIHTLFYNCALHYCKSSAKLAVFFLSANRPYKHLLHHHYLPLYRVYRCLCHNGQNESLYKN